MTVSAITRPRVVAVSLLFIVVSVVVVAWSLVAGGPTADVAAEQGEVLAQDDQAGDEVADEEGDAATLDVATLEVTYDVFLARDPFESIRPPEPAGADGDGDGSSNGGTNGGTTNGGTSGGGTTNGGGSGKDSNGTGSDPCRAGTEAVCDGMVVVLKNVSQGQALVEVNGIEFSVAVGGIFATNFQVLQIDGECADFLYLDGDEADTFSLCIGDVVAK